MFGSTRPGVHWAWLIPVVGILVLSTTVVAPGLSRGPSAPVPRVLALYAGGPNPTIPIDHIVVVVQENHAYDNYFGTYCLVPGSYCSVNATGLPAGTCVPKDPTQPALGCIQPYRLASANVTKPTDLPHNWVSSHQSYDNGSMDGFYLAENHKLGAFGYYDGSQLPVYWDMAEQYGLGDNFFASVLSYSMPNHWYLMAGQSPEMGVNFSLLKGPDKTALTANEEEYLDESNATPTIEDLLVNSSVSWTYYDWSLTSYTSAIRHGAGAGVQGSAFDYWNPLASRGQSYASNVSAHFVGTSRFFSDAAAGQLPNVSWVIPAFNDSDHAPANLQNGENWVSKVVNAVESSPDWNSTVVFVTWDDYGGFYDHIAPPTLDAKGLSFRAPFFVIGPYVRENFVSHHFGYFESILHFIEWRFGLDSLTDRDANAPLPLEYFDFNASPRRPMVFGNATTAVYPMALQSVGTLPLAQNLTASAGPGSVTLNWTLPRHTTPLSAYLLTYGPTSTPTLVSVRVDSSVTSLTVSNLKPLTGYTFALATLTGATTSAATTITVTPALGVDPSASSSTPAWAPITPAPGLGPTARSGAAFVYDAADRVDLLFGGVGATGGYLADSWAYVENQWVRIAPSTSPSPRADAQVAYDSVDGMVLLFGGHGPGGPLGDLWKFSGGRWTNLSATLTFPTAPSARWGAAFTMDYKDRGVLLFGGTNGSGALGDTWMFVRNAWSSIAVGATHPSERWGAAMTFDAADNYILLFGGNSSTGSALGDAWRYALGSWRTVNVRGGPPSLIGAAAVYEGRDRLTLLTGGASGSGYTSGTWSFAAGKWTTLSPAVSPAARADASVTYDALHQGILYGFGFGSSGAYSDLWVYVLPLSVRLMASPTFDANGEAVLFFPLVSGGFGVPTYVWNYGDGLMATILYGWHLYSSSGTYTVTFTVTDAAGLVASVSIPVHFR